MPAETRESIIRILLLSFVLVLIVGCNYSHQKTAESDGGNGGLAIDLKDVNLAAVDYSVAGVVLTRRCGDCHAEMKTYAGARSKYISIGQRALVARTMPPGNPLDETESRILRAWIDLGAPEKISGPIQKPDPDLEQGLVTWEKVREKVFRAKCLDCHSTPDVSAGPDAKPDGDLDLTSLAQTREKAAKIFEAVIVKQTMPFEPYPLLTPKERALLLQWFDAGMPE